MNWEADQRSVGLIGAQEPETERLPVFLSERGFTVQRWPALVPASSLAAVKTALVLFADAFETGTLIAWLQKVTRAAPGRLVIVLTAPARFTGPTALSGENVVLLVRPVLAWQLVDVIRNHLQRKVKVRA